MKTDLLLTELQYKAVRSSGAGGQNVNKVSSKVVLTFDLNASQALSEEQKILISEKLATKLTSENILILNCDEDLSQINNKEKRLISNDDLFAWLNEGYTRVRNSFNLVNRTDEISTDTITPSAQETALDDDFFKIVSVYDESAKEYLKPIEIKEIERYKNISSGQTPRYYVRRDAGTNYIGIVPVQDGTKNFTIWQETKITRLTKYSDSILLPDGNVYMLINFMLYKCYSKLGRGDALAFLELFENDTKEIKQQSALKIESGDDRWEIDRSCNI
jgi:hypothetical protein